MTLRISISRWCRDTRIELGITQQELARALGISRSWIALLESGRANPSLALVDRLGEVLGLEFGLTARSTIRPVARAPRDAVHARCSAYVQRRLVSLGWTVRREVEVGDRRGRGWVDLLAFDPVRGAVLIIEVKTSLDDIGALERQLGWYERLVGPLASTLGWDVRTVDAWVLALAADAVDHTIAEQAAAFRVALPERVARMRAALDGGSMPAGRGLALIDPRSRRRDWLIATRVDGRRSRLPYQDRAGAERLLVGRR